MLSISLQIQVIGKLSEKTLPKNNYTPNHKLLTKHALLQLLRTAFLMSPESPDSDSLSGQRKCCPILRLVCPSTPQ